MSLFFSSDSLAIKPPTVHCPATNMPYAEGNPKARKTMSDHKSCWTCKDRRVPCDGGHPTCRKCARGKRECQGYGIRLSWPRTGDVKRALTAGSTGQGAAYPSSGYFISTTWRDVELYKRSLLLSEPKSLTHTVSGRWMQSRPKADYMDLLRHFHTTAYKSLVTFGTINTDMRDMLMRMARCHYTPAGLGLFSALLAFSSLHRNGLDEQTIQFKVSAIQCLAAVTGGGALSQFESAQHVAASMLLGAFEIFLPPESSGEWLSYVFGAMDMTQASLLQSQPCSGDLGHLLDWVHYQNTIARFPVHHWRHRGLLGSNPTTSKNPEASPTLCRSLLSKHRPSAPSPNPTHAILNLLSDAFDTLLLNPLDPRRNTTANHHQTTTLQSLEQRAKTLPMATTHLHDLSSDPAHTARVFQIATRIYLARATATTPGQKKPYEDEDLEAEIDGVFSTFINSCSCPHFFPLFVAACEARSDERRLAILSLLDRIRDGPRGKALEGLKKDIRAIWVQQDLHADDEVLEDYLGIMGRVISSGDTLHSFV